MQNGSLRGRSRGSTLGTKGNQVQGQDGVATLRCVVLQQ